MVQVYNFTHSSVYIKSWSHFLHICACLHRYLNCCNNLWIHVLEAYANTTYKKWLYM